jgi:nitrate reductase NapE component
MSDPHADHKPHVHETPPLHDPVDEWHDHSKDEKPQEAHAEVGNAYQIMGIGIALFLVIVVAVVATYGFYVHQTTLRLAKAEEVSFGQRGAPAIEARIMKSDALIRQSGYGWEVVPAAGDIPARSLVRLPIGEAKRLTARDYARVRN